MKPKVHEHVSKSLKIFVVLAAFASLGFSPNNEPRKIKVVLDAGHGGNDYGVKHDQFTEKQITSQIIEKIRFANKNENIDIQITRISDENISLADRATIINSIKPDLVLSLHVNYNKNSDVSGFEIYTSKTDNANNEKSAVFAKRLSDKLSKKLAVNNRGIKEAPLTILNKSESPAIVIELGFLSNANDRSYLTNNTGQDQIAETILEFISEME
jgi:N-acetylmuramoyl-L-alanine amidase